MKDNDKRAYEAPTTDLVTLHIESRILNDSLDPLGIIPFLEEEGDGLEAE